MSTPPKPHAPDTLFPKLPFSLTERAEAALANEPLQRFVARTTVMKDGDRRRTLGSVFGEKTPRLKTLAGEIKQHTLDHLDHYLAQFIDRARAAGMEVHGAATAEEANAICVEIARAEDVRVCVKSKSMVTEEIRLLPALEAAGIETWETDLGEFILQLDGDAPSHLVAPMIHKDRAAVARAFQRELGARYTEDPRELTMIARAALRERFLTAGMGMTGANFLVAESGSVVVCTNEGNARFSATTPRVLVVMTGIEKLVPTLEHLTLYLKLLARSSTGQPLTVYTQLVNGPRAAGERDGPERVHIILLDNGRGSILADPNFRPALRCIRCGACLNACPVYRKIGGHSYGSVYPGPIGAVITPLLRGLAAYKDLPQASSLCDACFDACPVSIDLPSMLVQLRRDEVTKKIGAPGDRFAFRLYALSLSRPWIYRLSSAVQRRMLRAVARDGMVRRLPGPLGRWTKERDLPAPAAESFRGWWARRARGNGR